MVQHSATADVRLLGNVLSCGVGITEVMKAMHRGLQDSRASELAFGLLPGELPPDFGTGFACQARALDVE